MKFGFGLPTRGPLANLEGIRTMAQRGEALGYEYLTIPDHLVIPRTYNHEYPYSDTGEMPGGGAGDCLDQLTVMTYAAAVTTTPRLLTSVLVVPHRPAVLTAKMFSTIDVLSEGRVTVGVGAGWMKEEFEALGTPPHAERGKVTDEYIRAFKELWTQENPSMQGDYVNFSDVIFDPKPVQKPHPPIFIGGESGPAFRRVIELGDGWYPIGANPRNRMDTRERYKANVEKLHAQSEEKGREPASITLAFWANWAGIEETTADDGSRRIFMGSSEEIASDVEFFREMGVSVLNFNFLSPTLSEALDKMELYAKDILHL
jgi:probable F420-dependent oxidoreductase